MSSLFERDKLRKLTVSVVLGLVTLILSALIFSVIVLFFDVKTAYLFIIASFIILISSYVSGLSASLMIKSRGLIYGIISGTATYIIVMIISAFAFSNGLTLLSLIRMAIALISGGLGGITGKYIVESKRISDKSIVHKRKM